MGNRDKYSLNFLPMYRYEFKIIGIIILLLLVVCKILVAVFHWEQFINYKVINWMMAISLIIISYSKDRVENHELLLLRYYSGKIALTYVISFIMSISLVDIIINRKFGLTDVVYIILAFTIYLISYYCLKIIIKNNKIEVEEQTVTKTILNHRKFFFLSIVAAVITVCLIFLLI